MMLVCFKSSAHVIFEIPNRISTVVKEFIKRREYIERNSVMEPIKISTNEISKPLRTQFKLWKRERPAPKKNLKDHQLSVNTNYEWITDLLNASLITRKTPLSELQLNQLSSKQTQILATLVPDEVIHMKDLKTKEIHPFVGVLLFADVSGFTSLCEKYNNTGKGGTYRLTATLNAYIGAMVEVIYSHGGDVLKFSGDAFLAIWKVKHEEYLYQVVHRTIMCALCIQQNLGHYETDVKVSLTVKLAIAAGNLMFSVIGDEVSRHYIICGAPIDEVKEAEHVCTAGDVILSLSAWGHCNSPNYEFTMKDPQHVKVTRIIYHPDNMKREVVLKYPAIRSLLESRQKNLENSKFLASTSQNILSSASRIEIESILNQTILRPSVAEACRLKLGARLRPFVIPPVVQQVDADQQLEFLTEMRQVTTMFVNLIPEKVPTKVLIHLVDEAYTTISRHVRTAMGCVNKVCMFDKDIMCLVIFGLRGCKHEAECQSGLTCAYNVLKSIRELEGIQNVSIGVTTGMVYCGVVGHTLRREYTIIGAPVNKAARLMCAYPSKVSCDHTTFQNSKLPPEKFILQEEKALKGIKTVGNIYEYTEEREWGLPQLLDTLPFLGRGEIMEYFTTLLEKNKETIIYSCLVIEGEPRIGKSRLLYEIVNESQNHDCQTMFIALSSVHHHIPYAAIYRIYMQVLGLDENASCRDREERILDAFGGSLQRSQFCFLNDALQVKFPHSTKYLLESPKQRNVILNGIFESFMKERKVTTVIAIDNGHFIDTQSWELVKMLVNSRCAMLILTLLSSHKSMDSPPVQDFLNEHQVLRQQLDGLEAEFMAPLACQFLNVRAIASKLESILQKHGGGNPGWCQTLLTSLLQAGGLKIQRITDLEERRQNFAVPDESLISKFPKAKRTSARRSLKPVTYTVCVMAPDYNMNSENIPATLDGLIMSIFDSLNPFEQLLLKSASVLGDTFTRTMLEAIMTHASTGDTAQAVKRLFEMHIFCCGMVFNEDTPQRQKYVRRATRVSYTDYSVTCYCSDLSQPPDYKTSDLPKYAFCQLLQFKVTLFQVSMYELLPGNQRKDFHARAVQFLENEDYRCRACGGKGLITISPKERKAAEEESVKSESSGESWSMFCKESSSSESDDSTVKSNSMQIQNQFDTKANTPLQVKGQTEMNIMNLPCSGESAMLIGFGNEFKAVDFTNCECPLILSGVYQQLIHHCTEAELHDKKIFYLIRYGAISIASGNNSHALQLLNTARELLDELSQKKLLSSTTEKLYSAKIYGLMGQACLDFGNLEEAKFHLRRAMRTLGSDMPETPLYMQFARLWQYAQLAMQRWFPKIFVGRNKGNPLVAEYSNEKASVLSHISNLYMLEENWLHAELAALKSLKSAQKSNNDLYELCAAYSNVMDICYHKRMLDYSKKLEKPALKTCKTLYKGSESNELMAIGRLYFAVFLTKLLRGEITSSIKTGFRTLEISDKTQSTSVKLTLIPILIQALIMNGRIYEANDLMHALEPLTQNDVDKSSQIWHYAQNVDLLLETGFMFEDAKACWIFAHKLLYGHGEEFTNVVIRDADAMRRLITSVWVWTLRWKKENRKVWGLAAYNYCKPEDDDSFSNYFSTLRFLEGLLLTIASHLDEPNRINIPPIKTEAIRILKMLEKVSEAVKVIQPRLLHLKAYFFCLHHNKTKALEILKEAQLISEQQQNKLETAWMMHSLSVWTETINKVDKNFWTDHIAQGATLDWRECNVTSLTHTTFSLPIPRHAV